MHADNRRAARFVGSSACPGGSKHNRPVPPTPTVTRVPSGQCIGGTCQPQAAGFAGRAADQACELNATSSGWSIGACPANPVVLAGKRRQEFAGACDVAEARPEHACWPPAGDQTLLIESEAL